jgi:DNA invertase Pin-like site-specific DNA recombinase
MKIDKITPNHLARTAIVYVRQSSITQVLHNRESQQRQYDLARHARDLGFARVEVIDEDLGRSAAGTTDRPGFQKLVAAVCAGVAGAILCIEASRLARNGRDWHHLIDLCALVATVIIDPDGVYDPRQVNDRLLLGMKGTMSEFELTLLQQRSRAAIDAKAKRGALEFGLAVGLRWTEDGRIEMDPDERVRHAIETVFAKFTELGSVRQILMWLREQQWKLPVVQPERGHAAEWTTPAYRRVLAFVRNPFYAGAYAFGMRAGRTTVIEGRAHRSDGHPRPMSEWPVLIRDHHPGYITWEQYERNQARLAENAHMHGTQSRKAARGGAALLAGVLRCARCGRMLHVMYARGDFARYQCRYENRAHGAPRCISFSNLSL